MACGLKLIFSTFMNICHTIYVIILFNLIVVYFVTQ